MVVCRTCLLDLTNAHFYSIDHTLDDNNEINNDSNKINLRKMIEKCVPEMDLDICDSPVICDGCYELLKSAYKFRMICVQTEEKIYQYIEKNNLRLGESIDLSNLAEKRSNERDIVLTEEADIKQENGVSVELDDIPPLLIPEIGVRSECQERQLIIKLCRISHSVEKTLESEPNRVNKNIDESQETENSNDESRYKKKPYTCENCQYKANTWTFLKRHLKLKKCTKKHKCDECSYNTWKLSHFKRHKMTHTKERPFVCGVCGKSYTAKWSLRIHMLDHQSGNVIKPQISSNPFRCQEEGCEEVFPRKCDLSAHMVTHIKENPHICKVCEELSFITKTELRVHEKICAQKN